MDARQSTKDLLKAIESKGFSLTLELRGTAQKWVTGKNYFMGITGPDGMAVRNAYGPLALEMPRSIDKHLVWKTEEGALVEHAAKALRLAVESGRVRRSTYIHNAMLVLASCSK